MATIHEGDCLEYLDRMEPVRTIFIDPPDNIGLPYSGFADRVSAREYEMMLELVIRKSVTRCANLWLSYYHQHDLTVSRILAAVLRDRAWGWRKVIWRFTFGQYRDTDLASGYRPILWMWRPDFKAEWDKIRVVSERMLLGDSRAKGPRVPDDVWEIPRIVGNSPERRAWHPTQHPEELLERILLLSGGPVTDLFAGTGTTGRVARRLGLKCDLVERSAEYCQKLREEFR